MLRWLLSPVDVAELDHPDGPRWLGSLTVVVPVGAAVLIGLGHHALVPPTTDLIWIVLALAPFVLAYLGLALTPPLFSALTGAALLPLLGDGPQADLSPFLLLAAATYAGMCGPGLIGVAGFAVAAGVMVFVQVAGWWEDGAVIWTIGFGLAWVAGAGYRLQLGALRDLRSAQASLASQAADQERRRIAHEIHDVVAHSLTVTMLHVTGARMSLRHDPDDAEAALLEAERLGRRSLTEIRRTVGLLAGDAASVVPPAPGPADLAELVDEHRAAGRAVVLEVDGALGRLDPAVGLGIYRIAQEALTNAAKHAPEGSVTVRLAIGDTVELTVENGGPLRPSDGHGLGLASMRERAVLLDGELAAGPTDGGGWRLAVCLPLSPQVDA